MMESATIRLIQGDIQGYQTIGVAGEAINTNNLHQKQNIHQDYYRRDVNGSGNGQSSASQTQQTNLSNSRNKAVQVDHVAEQCVTRRNTFSGKNPLYLEDNEKPVFVNNYYAGDNPQQMFHEVGQSSKRSDFSNYH